MRRSFGLAAVLVALSLAFPLTASAGPQGARMPPGTIIYDLPAGLVCPAATGEVIWTLVDGQDSVVAKPDGRVMLGMGTSHVEIASVATGKSVVLKVDGVISVSPAASGAIMQHSAGTGIWGFFPGDAGPGDRAAARTFYMVGTQNALVAADGTAVHFSYSGRILMDVCAAIS